MSNRSDSKRRLDHGDLMALAISAVVIIIVAAGMTVTLWSVRDQLPAAVATHWGSSGQADSFAPLGSVFVENLLLSALAPLGLLLLLGVVMRQQVRYTAAFAIGMAVFIAGLSNASVWMQRGMSADEVAASDAPRLMVDDSVRVAWTGRTRSSAVMWAVLGLGVLAVAIPAIQTLLAGSVGLGLLLLILAAFIALSAFALSGTVTVDARGLRVRSLGAISWATIPLDSIAGATVAEVRPLADFGGWGRRLGRDGSHGVITASGPALRLDRGDEGAFLITVQDAESAAAAVNTLVNRRNEK
ncbi:DUF1648 domain-containing protein [Propionimicrobium sp. PCR01-08-3]|uniref:DUF1648 domain-containing protein n=1 Tax=Propionimicrobium sp. PCR01-08-3 TaxID=3052086 RepID=UPI00255C9F63|nr:DUF1648 domain-containing protein [Propionimicrobium sp. PCR01-08-3]WIY83055.1 DUF1648 domain-containing protein [Propionimicrobium sp. PCR01-08-3]